MHFSKDINEKLSGVVIRCHFSAVLVRQKYVGVCSLSFSVEFQKKVKMVRIYRLDDDMNFEFVFQRFISLKFLVDGEITQNFVCYLLFFEMFLQKPFNMEKIVKES